VDKRNNGVESHPYFSNNNQLLEPSYDIVRLLIQAIGYVISCNCGTKSGLTDFAGMMANCEINPGKIRNVDRRTDAKFVQLTT
jgi:hypothetical protein